jgi:DNA-binding MarR family transcriptional regulator
MPLVGNLRDWALHDFLVLVDRGHKTGSLQLERPAASDSTNLFFDHGRLLAVIKPYRRERLGDLLVRMNKVTPQQVTQALHLQQMYPGQPLGQVLVSQGAISQDELQRYIQQQIEETMYELFVWREGEFRFLNGQRPDPDDVQSLVPLPIEGLIMEGVRRADELSRIRGLVPHNDMVVRFIERQQEPATMINLTADEWRIFARINGRLSINELAAGIGLSPFQVSQAVYNFIAAGLVELIEPPRQPEPRPVISTTHSSSPMSRRAHESSTPIEQHAKGLVDRLFGRRRSA